MVVLVSVPRAWVVPWCVVVVWWVSVRVVLGWGVLGASWNTWSFTVGRLMARAQLWLQMLLLEARRVPDPDPLVLF